MKLSAKVNLYFATKQFMDLSEYMEVIVSFYYFGPFEFRCYKIGLSKLLAFVGPSSNLAHQKRADLDIDF